MEIVKLDLANWEHRSLWDDFCQYESDAWFWHTTQWMNYTLNYRMDRHPVNHSFMIMEDGQVMGIVPLIQEVGGQFPLDLVPDEGTFYYEFAYGAGPTPAPLLSNYAHYELIAEAKWVMASHIDALAISNMVARGDFQVSPLVEPTAMPLNAPQFGYTPFQGHSQILPLDRHYEALIRQMRKGHAYDVKRGLKMMNIYTHAAKCIDPQAFSKYEQLHAVANGRVCRNHHTFKLMEDWVWSDNGVLFEAELEGHSIGFIYVFLYKDGAYFGSACNDPAYRYAPIGHALQGKAIQWLLEHGYKRYELGLQYSADEHVTEKERAVAHFKHGFGGVTVPVYKWERTFGKEESQHQRL